MDHRYIVRRNRCKRRVDLELSWEKKVPSRDLFHLCRGVTDEVSRDETAVEWGEALHFTSVARTTRNHDGKGGTQMRNKEKPE